MSSVMPTLIPMTSGETHPVSARDSALHRISRPYLFDIPARAQAFSPPCPPSSASRITAKRQATFPAAALRAMRVKPGDCLELIHDRDEWRLAPVGIDLGKLGTLREKISANHPPLDLAKWRDTPKDHARLRD